MSFKVCIFFTHSSRGNLVHWCGTILAIFAVRHIDNMPVKFDTNWSNDIRGAVI